MKSSSKIPLLNTLEVQEGNLGRPFRMTSLERVPNTTKFIDRLEQSHWLYIFKYVYNGSCFAIELDYYNEIVKVTKNYVSISTTSNPF